MRSGVVLTDLIDSFVGEHSERPAAQIVAGIVRHDELRREDQHSDVVFRNGRKKQICDLQWERKNKLINGRNKYDGKATLRMQDSKYARYPFYEQLLDKYLCAVISRKDAIVLKTTNNRLDTT